MGSRKCCRTTVMWPKNYNTKSNNVNPVSVTEEKKIENSESTKYQTQFETVWLGYSKDIGRVPIAVFFKSIFVKLGS